MVLQWLLCQASGVIGSELGLVGPVLVYCDWVRWKVGSGTPISVWQPVKLSRFVFCLFSLLLNVPFHTLVYFRDGSAQTSLRAATLRQKLQIKAFHLTQSQYTDTGPTSPKADPITPGAWQGSHWNANV